MGRPLSLLALLVSLGCATSADRETVNRRSEEIIPVRAAMGQQREAENGGCQEQVKDKNGKTVCVPAPPAYTYWQDPDRL